MGAWITVINQIGSASAAHLAGLLRIDCGTYFEAFIMFDGAAELRPARHIFPEKRLSRLHLTDAPSRSVIHYSMPARRAHRTKSSRASNISSSEPNAFM
jgi:hypothetical protein